MITRREIFEVIGSCVSALNSERGTDEQIPISRETLLLAQDSSFSSLDVVSLSVDLEERIRRLTKRDFDISPAALAVDEHPLRTLGTLADFLAAKLEASN